MRRVFTAALMASSALVTGLGYPAAARAQAIADFSADFATAQQEAIGMAADGRFVVAWQSREDLPAFGGIWVRRFDSAAQPLAAPFRVSTATPLLKRPAVAVAPAGEFTVVWSGRTGYGGWEVQGRRFDAAGVPVGNQFAASTGTLYSVSDPALAVDAAGNTVVAWTRGFGLLGQSNGARVHARRFDATGAPLGAEFQVNTYTGGHQLMPAVAFDDSGGFVVAWHGTAQDGSAEGVFAQRYAASGAPLGGEVPVNTYTTGIQAFTCVGRAGNGGFVIGWVSSEAADDAGAGIFARQFDAAGNPLGPELRVSDTPVRFAQHACSVAADARGGYAISWSSGTTGSSEFTANVRRYDAAGNAIGSAIRVPYDSRRIVTTSLAGNGAGRLALAWSQDGNLGGGGVPRLVEGRLFGAVWPLALAVDETPGLGDRNGVLDPGEAAVVAPTWINAGVTASSVSGTASAFTGPAAPPSNPSYVLLDGAAQYGTLAPAASASCAGQNDCYLLGVSVPVPRPQPHMDATFLETLTLAGGEMETATWRVHIGGSFDDVARGNPFYRFVETLLHNGVSTGCTAATYCPAAATTREQMAVFLLTAKMGAGYQAPRPATGLFGDVPPSNPFAPWIEDLALREVVTGCGGGSFCPQAPVTRAQMAVMVLRGAEGPSYQPPACLTAPFNDVPCSDPFARWIAEIARRGITSGCGNGAYCPGGAVTREQMAVFLARGFSLPLYGP